MRKICLFAMLLLSLPVAGARADQATDLSIWAGYTSYAMGDINNFLQDSVGSNGSVTKVSNGFLIGADALFQVDGAPKLWLGPRVEYLSCNQGKASNGTTSVTEDQYLVPILVGGKYRLMDNGSKFILDGKFFLGFGLGYATTDVKSTAGGTATDTSVSYSGTGFVMELGLGSFYKISSNIDIDLDLGYRLANLGSMGSGGYGGGGSSSTGNTGFTYAPGLQKASLMDPQTGSTVTYDFSGLMINLGATYHFK